MSDVLARLMRWMETSDIDDADVVLRDAITEIAGLRARLHEHRIAAQRLAGGQPMLTDLQRAATDPVDFGGLTDKEREAIEKAIGRELDAEWYGGKEPDRVVALRGLLERTQ